MAIFCMQMPDVKIKNYRTVSCLPYVYHTIVENSSSSSNPEILRRACNPDFTNSTATAVDDSNSLLTVPADKLPCTHRFTTWPYSLQREREVVGADIETTPENKRLDKGAARGGMGG